MQVQVPFPRAIGISRSSIWDGASTIGDLFDDNLGEEVELGGEVESELPWSSLSLPTGFAVE